MLSLRRLIGGQHALRAANQLKELLKKGSTLIVLGPGGVGKTTVAAALGLAAGARHLDTAVITVDPARRLRDALGLERLSGRPTLVDTRRLRAAGLDPSLRLSAMVLDVKRSWHGLVERFVRTPAARRRILENSFYRSLTEQFAGAEAYAALEQLYDLHSAARFEIEIVDTPPASHAFEFIQAPANLIRLLDSRTARWLFMPGATAGKTALGLAGRATRFVVDEIERFAGTRTLSSVSEFFGAAAEAADAIIHRLRKTEALLRSPAVHFVLVTTAEEDRLNEALDLVEQMEAEGLRLSAIVLNRLVGERSYEALTASPRRVPDHLEEVVALRAQFGSESIRELRLDALLTYLENYGAHERSALGRAARFAEKLPARIELAITPEIESGVCDLATVARISRLLAGAGTGRQFLSGAATLTTSPRRKHSTAKNTSHW